MKKEPEKTAGEGKRKLRAASMSLYVNIFLILIKFVVMILTNSLAILAELLHSFFDMLASLFAYVGIRKADQPPDHDHQYGHEKFENLSSLAQTILIVITSFFVIYEAVNRLRLPVKVESTELGLAAMAATIVVDYFLSRYLHATSKAYGSAALEADAYHFTTDLWGALAVIVGLVFVYMGFPFFDSLAAIFVALLMLWISYKLGKKSFHVFMDTSPQKEVMEDIRNTISSTGEVASYHKLRVRQAGSKLFIDVHIQVAPKMSVEEGHYVAHRVKERLLSGVKNVKEVTVHVEPNVSAYRRKVK